MFFYGLRYALSFESLAPALCQRFYLSYVFIVVVFRKTTAAVLATKDETEAIVPTLNPKAFRCERLSGLQTLKSVFIIFILRLCFDNRSDRKGASSGP